MKLPYSWLSQLVDHLPPPEELAKLLTMRGFEIEGMESPGAEIRDVVIAKLLEMEPHPDADKLTLCKVNDGAETHAIVCGAKNMKPGDCVALARVGTVLPGDFKIEKRKIRGQASSGMMCSKRELGLGDDHAGILILPGEAPLGTRLVDYLGLDDVVFEISVTPNRPDVLSAIGMAREIAAAVGSAVRMPDGSPLEAPGQSPSVTLEAEALCPRYTALVIKDLKIGPSPEWLKKRLEGCGVRSINNVVDATNLVLMEMGQPLHAFDLNKLKENRIVVRQARPGEKIVTIDEEERELSPEMLVIADAEAPVAVAGVMGGLHSEVDDKTTDVLLESAFFHPPSIRRTSKTLGLSSEASYRFERGVDFEMVIPAAWRCAHLMAELAGGRVEGALTVADAKDAALFEPLRERSMTLDLAYCTRLLGKALDRSELERIFNGLDLTVQSSDAQSITVRIPSYRKDIQRQADLVEEAARCHGYNEFSAAPMYAPVKAPEAQPVSRALAHRLREYLLSAGLDEAVTYSFTDPSLLKAFPPAGADHGNAAVTILNPINSQEGAMRSSMLPSLLQCARRNMARGNLDFGLFESARTYQGDSDGAIEKKTIAGVIAGGLNASWRNQKHEFDFFDLKGLVEGLLATAGVTRFRLIDGPDCLHPHRGVSVQAGKAPFGYFGELHPNLAEEYNLTGRVCVFELELDPMGKIDREKTPQFKPYSIFPAVRRDLAFLLPDGVSASDVEKVVRQEGGDLLEDVRLFDYYKGKQVAQGFSSVAFRLTFRSPDETLKEETVDSAREAILSRLQSKLNVQLRS
ncbi:MAG: phenylalanine--tRNA ligase subunit beta [bacterium]|nr:phenylalanine--tRNA ligase subunit beta [bacterium]